MAALGRATMRMQSLPPRAHPHPHPPQSPNPPKILSPHPTAHSARRPVASPARARTPAALTPFPSRRTNGRVTGGRRRRIAAKHRWMADGAAQTPLEPVTTHTKRPSRPTEVEASPPMPPRPSAEPDGALAPRPRALAAMILPPSTAPRRNTTRATDGTNPAGTTCDVFHAGARSSARRRFGLLGRPVLAAIGRSRAASVARGSLRRATRPAFFRTRL